MIINYLDDGRFEKTLVYVIVFSHCIFEMFKFVKTNVLSLQGLTEELFGAHLFQFVAVVAFTEAIAAQVT